MLPSPRAEQLPRDIIYIDVPAACRSRSVIPFLRRVTSRPFPGRERQRETAVSRDPRSDPVRFAVLLRVLRAKPGVEHSFAEEAKVEANYRAASREGGLMRSSMTGHIRCPNLPLFAPVADDDSTLASKSTDRNSTTDTTYLFLLLSFLHSLLSIRFPRAFLRLFSTGFFSPLLLSRHVVIVVVLLSRRVRYSTVTFGKRSEERSEKV